MKHFDPTSLEFLFTELRTGLTFANLALSAKPNNTGKIKNDTENARKAHDSFLKFRERVALSEPQKRQLDAELEKLKAALRLLGETV